MMSRIQLVLLVIGAVSAVGLSTKPESSHGKTLSLSKILIQASKDSPKGEKESQDQCPVCPEISFSSCPVCDCLNDTHFDEQVAFTAEVLGDRAVTDGQQFIFDQILVDSSDSFTPIGIFTCPDRDIYFISWSIHALEKRVMGKLVMDGTDVKYGPVTAEYPGDQSGTSSMSSVVQCSTGAKIYVKAIGWPDALSCNQLKSPYSSITGFKIFPASSPDPKVAFTAELSTNSTSTDTDTLIFDHVLTNLGNAYNYQNGRFTCPANGVYVFNINHHVTNSTSVAYPRRNGSTEFYTTYSHNTYSTDSDSGTASATVLLECNKDEYIDVYGYSFRTYLAQTTSFAGFQLVDPERPLIAFHGRLSSFTPFIDGQTIKFDVAETNVGGFYYSSLGTFICPEDGLYFFSWTITQYPDSSDTRPTEARLMVGGEVWKQGPKTMINYSNRFSSASTQAVVQCPAQTAVWLEAVMTSSPTTAMTFHYLYTHFTGFRIPNI